MMIELEFLGDSLGISEYVILEGELNKDGN